MGSMKCWFNYAGTAFDKTLNSEVCVIMRACDAKEAQRLFQECVFRHRDDVIRLNDPKIGEVSMTGEEPKILGKTTIRELEKHGSAII